MKYWQLELKYAVDNTNLIDSIYLTSVICENALFNSEVMRFPDGSEQLFKSEKAAYTMIWDYLTKPYFTTLPSTERGKKMFEAFIPKIEKDFPEILI